MWGITLIELTFSTRKIQQDLDSAKFQPEMNHGSFVLHEYLTHLIAETRPEDIVLFA